VARGNPVLTGRGIIAIVVISALTNVALGHLAASRGKSA
jgi:hypothetical protein